MQNFVIENKSIGELYELAAAFRRPEIEAPEDVSDDDLNLDLNDGVQSPAAQVQIVQPKVVVSGETENKGKPDEPEQQEPDTTQQNNNYQHRTPPGTQWKMPHFKIKEGDELYTQVTQDGYALMAKRGERELRWIEYPPSMAQEIAELVLRTAPVDGTLQQDE